MEVDRMVYNHIESRVNISLKYYLWDSFIEQCSDVISALSPVFRDVELIVANIDVEDHLDIFLDEYAFKN